MMLIVKKEYLRNKTKYILITTILILLTTLMSLLDGLSEGLASGMNGTLVNAKGNIVIMSESAEGNIARSVIPIEIIERFNDIDTISTATAVGYYSNVASMREETANVSFFGVYPDTIAEPDVIHGNGLGTKGSYQVIVDESFIAQHNLKIGDKFNLNEVDEEVTIIGITGEQRFSMQPSVFIHMDVWCETREGMEDLATFMLAKSQQDQSAEEATEELAQILGEEYTILPTLQAANKIAGVQEMALIPFLLKWLTFAVALRASRQN